MTTAVPLADSPDFRPAYHFTPAARWMNDPNGMVFHQGVYHLFFQYHPGSAVWGPMHWGHATSTDLLCWQEQPIALRPDALGMIFSGSAVVDHGNRAGFGPAGSSPLVAMFTHHDSTAEQAGRIDGETQSLASSLDGGQTWTPYAGNPVIANPGRKDFRDPKLRWLAERQRWLVSLACGDHVAFYSSADLKTWVLESEFGAGLGAQGGVWECPDLLPLPGAAGRVCWVLLVSLTTGGPNGGSATQYFVGHFDGHRFTADDDRVRWLDAGPDNYAGVTWAGVDDRALFIGWMSNWAYAKALPTAPWRGAMTMPRELVLRQVAGETLVASQPARELLALQQPATLLCDGFVGDGPLDLSAGLVGTEGRFVLRLATAALQAFTLTLANGVGDALHIGFDPDPEHPQGHWWIDRRHSGGGAFHADFAGRHSAPRLSRSASADLQLWFDTCSVELFADDGLAALSSLFFPRRPWCTATLVSAAGWWPDSLSVRPLRDPR